MGPLQAEAGHRRGESLLRFKSLYARGRMYDIFARSHIRGAPPASAFCPEVSAALATRSVACYSPFDGRMIP